MSGKRVFFPNLNGVRFLAALLVIIHHLEMAKSFMGIPNMYDDSFIGGVFGKLGIILFFVLSGFLITYLLLEERRRTKTISIKSFYWRRILRIWPVYYLIVVLSLFIFPKISFMDMPGFTEYMHEGGIVKVILYLTFLPNVGYTLYEHVPYAAQTWSVGVEEQFYIIWPLLMYWATGRKRVLKVLMGVISVYLLIKVGVGIYYAGNVYQPLAEKLWLFWEHFAIDCMAIGGLGAYWLFYRKEKVLRVLYNRYFQLAAYGILAIVTLKGITIPYFTNELYAVLFLVIILNLASNKKSLLNLEYKPLSYLGKVSYGLYMYHTIALMIVLKMLLLLGMNVSGPVGTLVYYLVSISLTVFISSLSYEYFEKPFLSVKQHFAKVQSGEKVTMNEAEGVKQAKPKASLSINSALSD